MSYERSRSSSSSSSTSSAPLSTYTRSAAVVSSAATLPIDVLKSNIMVSGGTLASTARSIVAARGVGALYSGFPSYTAINIAKWSVSMAVFRSLRGPDAGH